MTIPNYKQAIFDEIEGSITINVLGKQITVDKPHKDSDDWVIVQSESMEVDRQAFIFDAWNKDFGNEFKVKDFDQIVRICGTSRGFREWYARTSVLYSDSTQVPLFLKDMIEPAEYAKKSKLISDINKINAAGGKELQDFSLRVEKERKVIEARISDSVEKIVNTDKIVRILTLNATYLPISILLVIDNFSPKENPDVMKDLFAREMLITYKKALVQLVLDDPKIDIARVINEGIVK